MFVCPIWQLFLFYMHHHNRECVFAIQLFLWILLIVLSNCMALRLTIVVLTNVQKPTCFGKMEGKNQSVL